MVIFVLVALRAAFRDRKSANRVVFVTHLALCPVGALLALLGRPVFVVAHGFEAWTPFPPIWRWALRVCRGVVCVSDFTARTMAASNPGIGTPLFRVHLPVDSNAQRSPVPRISGRVLCVARLAKAHPYKGVDKLLESWPYVLQRVPQATLSIVGDGDGRDSLERIADRALDEWARQTVVFHGRLADEDLFHLYEVSSVFCLPVRESIGPANPEGEGFGMVFLEASSRGLPVIAGVSGGSREAVVPGKTGSLLEPNASPRQLADEISDLLLAPTRAAAMGEAGRRWVRQTHSRERFTAEIAALTKGTAKQIARDLLREDCL
ncbi:MAG: glycosyltransferase family 4 protein [Mycobacteriales bacterium]